MKRIVLLAALLSFAIFISGAGRTDFRPAYWEDLRVQVTGVNIPGAQTNPPTTDSTEDYGALTFPGANTPGATSDMAALVQMPHGWDNGTKVSVHLHLRNKTAGNGDAIWQLWHRKATPLGDFPAAWTVATLTYTLTPATTTHQLEDFPLIDMSGMGDSTVMMCLLRRFGGADTSTTDINLIAFDVHYLTSKPGSIAEYGDVQ